jgi:hypothetical protein
LSYCHTLVDGQHRSITCSVFHLIITIIKYVSCIFQSTMLAALKETVCRKTNHPMYDRMSTNVTDRARQARIEPVLKDLLTKWTEKPQSFLFVRMRKHIDSVYTHHLKRQTIRSWSDTMDSIEYQAVVKKVALEQAMPVLEGKPKEILTSGPISAEAAKAGIEESLKEMYTAFFDAQENTNAALRERIRALENERKQGEAEFEERMEDEVEKRVKAAMAEWEKALDQRIAKAVQTALIQKKEEEEHTGDTTEDEEEEDSQMEG